MSRKSWNYRLLAHEYRREVVFAIHEVFYNELGIPTNCTKEGAKIVGDDAQEVEEVIEMMKEALNKPILYYKTCKWSIN